MASNAELQQLWISAGGSPGSAPMAAAIALAESGGNLNATHTNSNGSIDRGAWQINSIHGAQSTLDPLNNARAAVAISNNGANWKPWTTFNSGAYKQFLSGASASPGSANQGVASSGNGGGWVADLFAPIFGTIGNWMIDAGMIVGGLIVFVWGTTVTILSTKEGKAAAKTAVGGALTVATGGTVKAATVGAVAAGVANSRTKAAAARSRAATDEKTSRNRPVDGKTEQAAQAEAARTSRSRMES